MLQKSQTSSLTLVHSNTEQSATIKFDSNRDYLLHELERLERRVEAYVHAAESGNGTDFERAVNELRESRTAVNAARRRAVERGVDIPFERLVQRFELAPEDEDDLLTCLLPQLKATIWAQLVRLQGDGSEDLKAWFFAHLLRPEATPLTDMSWCDHDSRLVKAGLLEVNVPTRGFAGLEWVVMAPDYVIEAVLGSPGVDERVDAFCSWRHPNISLSDVALSSQVRRDVQNFVESFPAGVATRGWKLVVADHGAPGSGKTMLADGIARALDRTIFTIDLRRLGGDDARARLDLALASARFLESFLHIVASGAPASHLALLRELLRDYPGLAIVETDDVDALIDASMEDSFDFAFPLGASASTS